MPRAKKCRRCGYGVAVLVILRKRGIRFKCDFCGAETAEVEEVSEAVKLWNRGEVSDDT